MLTVTMKDGRQLEFDVKGITGERTAEGHLKVTATDAGSKTVRVDGESLPWDELVAGKQTTVATAAHELAEAYRKFQQLEALRNRADDDLQMIGSKLDEASGEVRRAEKALRQAALDADSD
ncbi:hypothetical protein [Nocardioides sp. WS12]|uniref:hypothetical protein n=1 Tax=Nocardioides sp. WS12 TaxID=2486272 RepID=UPI0015F8FD18|nr:hypothetical protein [Nocardioides sp. WS12]